MNNFIIPGQVIEALMKVYHISNFEMSELLCVSLTTLRNILSGKEPITNQIAMMLVPIFNIPYRYWIKLQKQFDIKNI
jgi:addiction module HigA family antidote